MKYLAVVLLTKDVEVDLDQAIEHLADTVKLDVDYLASLTNEQLVEEYLAYTTPNVDGFEAEFKTVSKLARSPEQKLTDMEQRLTDMGYDLDELDQDNPYLTTTMCWKCSGIFNKFDAACPLCGAVNANLDPDKAMKEMEACRN